jgi:hypothetical protein
MHLTHFRPFHIHLSANFHPFSHSICERLELIRPFKTIVLHSICSIWWFWCRRCLDLLQCEHWIRTWKQNFWGVMPSPCDEMMWQNALQDSPWYYQIYHATSANLTTASRARFHGRLELDMSVQPALQRAFLEYRPGETGGQAGYLFRLSQSCASRCLQGNKVFFFKFFLPFYPWFPPI